MYIVNNCSHYVVSAQQYIVSTARKRIFTFFGILVGNIGLGWQHCILGLVVSKLAQNISVECNHMLGLLILFLSTECSGAKYKYNIINIIQCTIMYYNGIFYMLTSLMGFNDKFKKTKQNKKTFPPWASTRSYLP